MWHRFSDLYEHSCSVFWFLTNPVHIFFMSLQLSGSVYACQPGSNPARLSFSVTSWKCSNQCGCLCCYVAGWSYFLVTVVFHTNDKSSINMNIGEMCCFSVYDAFSCKICCALVMSRCFFCIIPLLKYDDWFLFPFRRKILVIYF